MEFNEYQTLAARTAIFKKDDKESKLALLGLGLGGEAGEVVDKIKKLLYYDESSLTEESRKALLTELGDALWYITQLAAEFDSSLEEIAQMNIKKLEDRASRGVVTKGEGDNR
ncbi:nucleoside triphosphate pyrophosphohydrolase family protein [Patescibacteria group bacterium]|nr:nucleoside triphosphate pyrophosphohydrolase family protein [Patescibacteria group bacterium]